MTYDHRVALIATMAATLYPSIAVPAGSGGTRAQVAVDTAASLLELAAAKGGKA